MPRPAITIAVVVVVASLLFLWMKRDGSRAPAQPDSATSAATATSAAKPAGRVPSAAAPPAAAKRRPLPSGVRRLKAAEDRQRLLRAIRAARHARAEKTGQPTDRRGDRPQLPPVTGSLDKHYIKSVIHGAIGLLKECYTLARDSAPRAAGKVVVEFVISGEPDVGGLVENAKITSDNALSTNPTMAECVTQTMLSLEYPAPSGGGKVTVRYPFIFRQSETPAPKRD